MIGQGRPRFFPPIAVRLGLSALAIAFLGGAGSTAENRPPVAVRVYVAWGSLDAKSTTPSPKPWRASLELSDGRWESLDHLATDPISVGTVWQENSRIRVDTLDSAVSINAFEADIVAPSDAILKVQFASRSDEPKQFEIPLNRLTNPRSHDLLSANEFLKGRPDRIDQPLDDLGNLFEIRVVGVEQIGIDPQRNTMIFSPGERWNPLIRFRIPGLAAQQNIRLQAGFRDASGKEISETTVRRTVQTDEFGQLSNITDFDLKLPESEGSHQFFLELQRQGLSVRKSILRRQFDVLVISPQAVTQSATATEKLVKEIDLSHSDGSHRLARLPRLPLPGVKRDATTPRIADRDGKRWVILEGSGWQAYPLTIDSLEVAHALDVEYESSSPQTLGIAVIEGESDGSAPRILADSGIQVPSAEEFMAVAEEPKAGSHRVIFWPRRRNIWLVFTNRQPDHEATYSTAKLYSLPNGLPIRTPPSTSERLAAIAFEQPRFAELFGGADNDTWLTYFQAAQRMIEFTAYSGYNCIVLPVSAQGGTLFPSSVWPNLPVFDRTASSNERQPIRKDIAELVFRLADRAGVRIIPEVAFESRLPALESLRQSEPDFASFVQNGSEVVEHQTGVDSKSNANSLYNPLHPQVQNVMEAAVREIVQRYGDHDSFAGVFVRCRPQGFGQLQSPEAGMSDSVFTQYAHDIRSGPDANVTVGKVSPVLYGLARTQWVDWSCQQISQLHARMSAATKIRPDVRLFLSLDELVLSSPQDGKGVVTGKSKFQVNALRDRGLDLTQLAQLDHLVLLQPHREDARSLLSQNTSSPRRPISLASRNDNVDMHVGSIDDHPVARVEIPRLPVRSGIAVPPSLFDRGSRQEDARPIELRSRIDLTGATARRLVAQALADDDRLILVNQSRQIPQGQQRTFLSWLESFRSLPLGRCESADTQNLPVENNQAVAVRWHKTADTTRIYAINDAPVAIDLTVKLRLPPETRFRGLTLATESKFTKDRGQRDTISWSGSIKPYDLAIAEVGTSDVTIVSINAEAAKTNETHEQLQVRLRNVESRLLTDKIDFETPDTVGWTGTPSGQAIAASADPESPKNRALELQGTGSLVVAQSPSISLPPTGCLSIQARVYRAFAKAPPTVRVRIDGNPDAKTISLTESVPGSSTGWHDIPEIVWQLSESTSNGSVRLAIELDGEGTVWFDDLKLSGFTAEDRSNLQKMMIAANNHLRNGRQIECAKILDGHWPRFLLTELPDPLTRMAQHPAEVLPNSAPTRKVGKGSWFTIPRILR
ncbi:MAG: family 10 glycosylhydrolase [Planctomycetota bacterium]|nr:family 10 glycosylhydrolase [Planctomycetota bacterium]MDA1177714.1 family 10 glycosylhydrolase [Planctomycetota bacterium]